MGKMTYFIIENASDATISCAALQKFFIVLVLGRMLGTNFLSDLELSFDYDITKIIFTSLFNWNCVFMKHNLWHFENDALAPNIRPSLKER